MKWIRLAVAVCLLFWIWVIIGIRSCHAEEINVNKLADSIRIAEGVNSRHPYGILSVKCGSEADCRRICLNTIKNNIRRYKIDNKGFGDYISYLGARYAPVGALNDKGRLNKNWVKNVKYYYYK